MNAHQRFVANLVANLTPANVAEWVACPPGGRSQAMSAAELHELVKDHADDATRVVWAELLADAADPAYRAPGWAPQWAAPIARMIFELPVPESAPVVELEPAA